MLEQKIEDLTAAVEALTAALLAAPANPIAPAQHEKVKVQITEISEPEIAAAAGPPDQDLKDLTLARSREGHKDAIRDELSALGAKKIGDLKGAQIATFYNWLKTLGSN
jgi:hypothetical protein